VADNPSYLADKEFVLWCDYCDAAKVKSNDPSTGTFHAREGHKWDFINEVMDDRYTTIIWAVCKDCSER